MEKRNFEYVQRIEDKYVSDDCVQIMLPVNDNMTLLSSDEVILYPNKKQINDNGFIKHFYAFNRVYIEIINGLLKEIYAQKDGNEALLMTKYIVPEESTQLLTFDEIKILLTKSKDFYNFDANCWQKYENNINDLISKSNLFIFVENGEINNIKAISINSISENKFLVKIYNYLMSIYSLEYLKKLELTNSKQISDSNIPRVICKNENDEVDKPLLLIRRKK